VRASGPAPRLTPARPQPGPAATGLVSETYRVAHAILGAGSAVVAFLVVSAPWLSSRPLRSLLGNLTLLVVHLGHLLWLRKGRPERAIKSFCFCYFVVVTAQVADFGGIRNPIGFVYPPLVLAAGLMWSGRAALGFAALCSASGLAFAWLESAGIISGENVPPPGRVWTVMTGALVITAVMLHVGLLALSRSQREALALRERLGEAERLEALGRLAGGIAHDFNNQLTAVLGHVDLLRRLSPDKHERSIEAIEHAALHAGELTRGLLQFGRRQALAPTRLDVRDVIVAVERLLRPSLGPDVQFEVALSEAPLCVLIDRVALERALVNLITNARDALGNGGTIRVSAQLQKGDMPAGHVEIEVRDDGVGMDDATRTRIFEPFFTTKGRFKGSGLGLASVHGIVVQSGGSIEVSSRLGQGSCFRLIFPESAAPAPRPVTEAPPGKPPRARHDTRILLVEDELQVRRVMQTVLVSAGYDVTAAAGVQEALRLSAARPEPFELLITDVLMPDGTGPELAESLQAQRPELLVLFTSAYPETALGPLERGAADRLFLPKPFTPAQLLQTVSSALSTPEVPLDGPELERTLDS
jgi:signal transduction histidine kinase/CheY-like chemotaxis protein